MNLNPKSRTRILVENSLASLLTRASNILVTLLLVPLSIKILGIEDYALVAIVISFSIFFTFSDLGLGSAIVKVVTVLKVEDKKTVREAITTITNAWFFLWFITFLISGVSILYYKLGGFDNYSFFLGVILIILNIPFSIYTRILFAMQKNLQSGLWQTGGKLLALIVIYISTFFLKISLNDFLLIFLGMPLFVNIMGTIFIFKKNKILTPKIKYLDIKEMVNVIKLGIFFVILQMVPYIETGIDNIILNMKYSLKFVGHYDVYMKLLLYIPALISVLVSPLWPAVLKAKSENDFNWIIRLKRKSYVLIFLLSSLVMGLMLIFSEKLILIWIGENFKIDLSALLLMGGVAFLYSLSLIQAMFLNGLGLIKEQVTFYLFYISIIIIFKLILITYFGIIPMLYFLIAIMFLRLIYMERVVCLSLSKLVDCNK